MKKQSNTLILQKLTGEYYIECYKLISQKLHRIFKAQKLQYYNFIHFIRSINNVEGTLKSNSGKDIYPPATHDIGGNIPQNL